MDTTIRTTRLAPLPQRRSARDGGTVACLLAIALVIGGAGCDTAARQRTREVKAQRMEQNRALAYGGRIEIRPAASQPTRRNGPAPMETATVATPPAITAPVKVVDDKGPAPAIKTERPRYEIKQSTIDGTGKFYMGREIAQVMGHLGAGWLERPQREKEEQPQKVLDAMELKKTDVVADIGAGTGYFSFRIAERVPEGKVLAVDIQQEMLDIVKKLAKAKETKNVEPVLGTVEDPNLPEGSVDLVLLVDAYHEFDHPFEMMTAIFKGLRPGGRVVQVEYRGEDPNVPIKPLHRMTEAQAKLEMAAVGLKHIKTIEELPQQHILIFEKPGSDKPAPAKERPKELLAISPRFSVSDLEKSVAYYREKLGFTVDHQDADMATVSRGGVMIQLVILKDRIDEPKTGAQFAADCDAYILVKNAPAMYAQFKEKGALLSDPPVQRGDMIEFDVSTPGGGILRFAQRSGGTAVRVEP